MSTNPFDDDSQPSTHEDESKNPFGSSSLRESTAKAVVGVGGPPPPLSPQSSSSSIPIDG
eukprot:CAMPEP_0172512774 /NCGR_PEP_ID=MMETSP1066-20121228/247120_1 /TAXON_ID=671091 /ORGANISM="Coscinodiscus wailesii, Strain CCMP2513" /LENGTH=59 /DNA_ID=CAMNT_0013292723 /DNA_START=30 /DNA_END=205 /DNA_ORIENTATION=+